MENPEKRRVSPSRIRWVLKEIQCILDEGIISSDSAHRLMQYYEDRLLDYKKSSSIYSVPSELC
jgi:hypothetical protein